MTAKEAEAQLQDFLDRAFDGMESSYGFSRSEIESIWLRFMARVSQHTEDSYELRLDIARFIRELTSEREAAIAVEVYATCVILRSLQRQLDHQARMQEQLEADPLRHALWKAGISTTF